MKTIGFGKLIATVLILSTLASCQEEEFYEKEFIDSLAEQYERENPTVTDGDEETIVEEKETTTPEESEESTSNTGSESSEESGSNSGSESSEESGSNSGSESSEESGSNSGDDSTSNEDQSEDETASNEDLSDDETANEEEVTEPEVALEAVSDSFTQNENGLKLDILWVIDNSGSMRNDQIALGDNFDAFIKEFVNKNIDFQMAITTTDTTGNNAGKVVKDSMGLLTTEKLNENKQKFMNDFKDLVNVGTRGSGHEKGIKASEVFTQVNANSWLRDDAYYIIVYMSDEEDQSNKDVPEHLKQIQKWKDNNSFIKAYSIVNMTEHFLSRYGYTGYSNYARYEEITNLTGGLISDINSDFYSTLLNMGGLISDLVDKFPLSKTPADANQIQVLVNGVTASNWSYDASSNSIKFDEGLAPAAESSISVLYDTVAE